MEFFKLQLARAERTVGDPAKIAGIREQYNDWRKTSLQDSILALHSPYLVRADSLLRVLRLEYPEETIVIDSLDVALLQRMVDEVRQRYNNLVHVPGVKPTENNYETAVSLLDSAYVALEKDVRITELQSDLAELRGEVQQQKQLAEEVKRQRGIGSTQLKAAIQVREPANMTLKAYSSTRATQGKILLKSSQILQSARVFANETEMSSQAIGKETFKRGTVTIPPAAQQVKVAMRAIDKEGNEVSKDLTFKIDRMPLRHKAGENLSTEKVKNMIKKFNFYSTDKYDFVTEWSNPNGKGIDNDFVLQQSGWVVLDRATGLMWQQSGSSNYMTFAEAQKNIDNLNKEGVFTGSYAEHPLTNEKIPVYAGNFVIAEYGSGMVMGVPAHDQRDLDFAKKYKIPIKIVIQSKNKKINKKIMKEAYLEEGILVNSDKFNDLNSREAKEHIIQFLKGKRLGKKTIQYKLRDWLVSRQRYWGTPIPMLYDEKGEVIPVDKKSLPVKLPDDVKFGKGNPLKTSKSFAIFRKNGKVYRRETDTMDTFFDSSWYFLRFIDSKNNKKIFDSKKVNYWMPVDFYTGGAEHACMHLIYARFFTKLLRDFGIIDKNLNEPFKRLFNQGMVHGEDGFVMSKSRGNVIDPLDMAEKYSVDSLRMFLVSVASPNNDFVWNTIGLESIHKFLIKVLNYFSKVKIGKSDRKIQNKINKTIKEVTEEIENLKYNLSIIKLRTLFDYLNGKEINRKDLESCIKLISPFCPHIAEELWEKLGN
ncbi:class I tRNA ligase family protein, partial [archaeon]|nr:class I tRNA ligase family protein [archaeon]